MIRKNKRGFVQKNTFGKKNVMIVSSMGPPPYLGGIENVVDTLIHSPLKEEYHFSVFDIFRRPDPSRTVFSKAYFAMRLPFLCLKHRCKNKATVAHIHFCSKNNFWKSSVCLITLKLLRVKTIFQLHGGNFDKFYQQSNPVIKNLIRFILTQPDFLIALSAYWHKFLYELSGSNNIYIVPNPINCELLSKYCDLRKKDIHKSVLLLGSIGHRKGHFDIVKALPLILSKNSNIHFYFAGVDEDSGATEELKQILSRDGGLNNVHFLGPVSGEDKLKLLASAGIVILPSYGENMPVSVLEGMAASKPIITTRVGALPEVIKDNVNGMLIDPGDWKALYEKILLSFENADFAYEMGVNAGKEAKEKYDVMSVSQVFDKIYKEL